MAGYKRYHGNSGRMEHVGAPERRPPAYDPPEPGPPAYRPPAVYQAQPRPPASLPPLLPSGLTEPLLSRLRELEQEDFLLMLILYLLYRESGDSELLIIMGAMFLL